MERPRPLGIATGRGDRMEDTIPDCALTASDSWDGDHGPERSRLHTSRSAFGSGALAWCAGKANMEWIRVDLRRPRLITGVAIQGRGDADQWVTEYRLLASVCEEEGYMEVAPRCARPEDVTAAGWGSATGLPTFPGAYDRDTPVMNDNFEPVVARYVKLIPVTFHGHRSLRWELYGTDVPAGVPALADPLRTAVAAVAPGLPRPLVGRLDAAAITATSSWGASSRNMDHLPKYGVLDCTQGEGAWAAQHLNLKQAWQVDLGAPTVVTEIRVQGRATAAQWVTAYCLLASMDGTVWYEVQPTGPKMRTFAGACSSVGVSRNDFFRPFVARFVRINPAAWSGHISIRADVVGFPFVAATVAPTYGAVSYASAAASGGAGGGGGASGCDWDRPVPRPLPPAGISREHTYSSARNTTMCEETNSS